MKEFIIEENEAGQRFDKYLAKLLKEAPKSFFYKMLRKKNITLNDRKATGNEKLLKGDTIKLFLSDETFDKFAGTTQVAQTFRQEYQWKYPKVQEYHHHCNENKHAHSLHVLSRL